MKRFTTAAFLLFLLQLGLAHAEGKGGFFDFKTKSVQARSMKQQMQQPKRDEKSICTFNDEAKFMQDCEHNSNDTDKK